MVTWSFFNFAVCRDARRRAGSSATADTWFNYLPIIFCRVFPCGRLGWLSVSLSAHRNG